MGIGKLIGESREGRPQPKPVERPRPRPEKALVSQRGLWEGSVHRRLLSGLPYVRESRPEPGMWLSPSGLSKFCPRAWTIAYRMNLPLLDEYGIDQRWYLDGGNAFHKMFQEEWLGPLGVIKGGWECQRCLHRVGFDPADLTPIRSHGEEFTEKVTARSAVTMPEVCPRCGMKRGWKMGWRFIEPLLYDAEARVCGWCDGILLTDDDEDEGWDLKTKVSTSSFEYVQQAPNPEDVHQLSWYLAMAGLKRGRIVYLDRSAKKLSEAIAEHTFELDISKIEKQKEEIRVFRAALENPESSLPPCPHGGQRRFGPCDCRGLQELWKGHGARPLPR